VLWDAKSRDIVRTFELDSPIVGVDFDARGRFIVADRLGRQTVILNITGDEGPNAVMLSDPIPEPADQSVAFDPAGGQRPTVVSSNGRYIVRYPCVACVSRDALIDELDRRLARANAG
jgi:hypothetical protein